MTEQRSATNEQIHELSFYAADTGRAYVIEHVDLYHDENITVGGSINFPDKDNPSVPFSMGSLESFKGDVEYIGAGLTPFKGVACKDAHILPHTHIGYALFARKAQEKNSDKK